MASGSITASVTTFALTLGTSSSLSYTDKRLSAVTGAFTEIGNVATLTKASQRTMVASKGTFTETGNAATPKVGRRVSATVTTFAETGRDAALTKATGRAMVSNAGAFVVNGGTSTSVQVYDRTLSAVKGTLTLTGNEALFRGSILSANTGTIAVSGKPAGFLKTWKIAGTTGSFALAGNAAGLSRSAVANLTAAAGQLVVTGGASTSFSFFNHILSAGKGTFAYAGNEIAWGHKEILASPGAFVLAGKDAISARYDYHLKGTFVLTGKAVNYKLLSKAGAFTLTGNAATLDKTGNKTLSASPGIFLETGNAAVLRRPRGISGTVTTFVEVGRAATLRRGEAISATVVPVVVSGSAATLRKTGNYALTLAGGSFVLTCRPASLGRGGRGIIAASTGEFGVTANDAILSSASYAWFDYPYVADAADPSVRWAHLYEFNLPNGIIRVTGDLLPIIYAGTRYVPYSISVDAITTEQGLVATGTLSIGNADNYWGNYIFQHDITGSVVKIWQAWMDPFRPTQVSASTRQVFIGRVAGWSLSRMGQDSTIRIALGPYSDPTTKIIPTRMVSDILRR